jgi:uncharacterized protein YbaR (Trm112 family)
MEMLNTEELLKILACPVCLGDLVLLEGRDIAGFACDRCRLVYPIKNDIPVMLQEEAVARDDWDAASL